MIDLKFVITQGDFTLNLELQLPEKGVTCLFGPSGSGKTTLLRAISGLDQHAGGYLKVGNNIWQQQDCFVKPHKRPLAYVFQHANLFQHLTVEQNIAYGYNRVSPENRHISLTQVISLLSLVPLLARKPASLSGGEQQRVAIARAIAVSPQLLLMDEPLASLDQDRKQEVLPYIESLPEALNIPIIYVSHATDEVARLADHLVLLDSGRMVASGPIAEMLTRQDLSLAQRSDAEAIIDATVSGYDQDYQLNYLEFAGGRFMVSGKPLSHGRKIRLRIAAHDVSLTLQAQSETSILNIFPAKITAIVEGESAQITVHLTLTGEIPLLARITLKSAKSLNLHQGKEVFVQIKSVAVLA